MPKVWHEIMIKLIDAGTFCTMADCMRSLFREGQAIMIPLWEEGEPTKAQILELLTINLNEHPTTVNLSDTDWAFFDRFDVYPKYLLNLCFYYALKKRKLIKKDGQPI